MKGRKKLNRETRNALVVFVRGGPEFLLPSPLILDFFSLPPFSSPPTYSYRSHFPKNFSCPTRILKSPSFFPSNSFFLLGRPALVLCILSARVPSEGNNGSVLGKEGRERKVVRGEGSERELNRKKREKRGGR